MKWRKNRVAIGLVAFAVLLGITIWAVRTRDQRAADENIELPTVEVNEDDVVAIEVTRPGPNGPEGVILTLVDGEWRVTVPVDAAADANSVSSALNRLTQLNPTQVVAIREENYPRLEVDDAQAVTVLARMKGDAPPLLARIGKYANGVTMVRLGDRPEVFAVKGSARYPFDRDLKTWRDRRITQAATANVNRIAFASENGAFGFSRQDDQWVPDGNYRRIKDFDSKQVEGLVSTAARLTASGFAPEDFSAARAGLNEPRATITLEVAPAAADEADESEEREEGEEQPPTPETIVLEIGEENADTSQFYLRRDGDPTIYLVSGYLANRLQPGPDAFERPPAPVAPPPTPQGVPGQPPTAPNQLPPEIMEQLQQQLKQQQMQQGQP